MLRVLRKFVRLLKESPISTRIDKIYSNHPIDAMKSQNKAKIRSKLARLLKYFSGGCLLRARFRSLNPVATGSIISIARLRVSSLYCGYYAGGEQTYNRYHFRESCWNECLLDRPGWRKVGRGMNRDNGITWLGTNGSLKENKTRTRKRD